MKTVPEEKRISLERIQKILKTTGRNYTEQQVKKIRDFLYHLAEIEYRAFIKRKEYEATGHNLHAGVHR